MRRSYIRRVLDFDALLSLEIVRTRKPGGEMKVVLFHSSSRSQVQYLACSDALSRE